MLNARAIYRLLFEDEPPVTPPDDSDDLFDPKTELLRLSTGPFTIPGAFSTSTYGDFQRKLAGARKSGSYPSKKLDRNTYLIDYGNRIAVRLHQTDVVTAYPDGKIVFDTGGWETVTTRDRFSHGFDGGWRIFQKDFTWYWYNHSTGRGGWESEDRYPFTSGDAILPNGHLLMQATPTHVRKRKAKV